MSEQLQIVKPQRNFKNIYLFASRGPGGEYDKKTIDVLNSMSFTENDCVVVFNSPHDYVLSLLKNKKINYCFARARSEEKHPRLALSGLNKLINNNITKYTDTEFFLRPLQKEPLPLEFVKDKKAYLLHKDIYINDNKHSLHEYHSFSRWRYMPYQKTGNMTIGFIGILTLNALYPNSKFHLIGFDLMREKFQGDVCHNSKLEHDYLVNNNIKHCYI